MTEPPYSPLHMAHGLQTLDIGPLTVNPAAGVVWTRADSEVQDVLHGLRFLERDMGGKLFRIGSFLRRYLD